jgi:hypothetical protein
MKRSLALVAACSAVLAAAVAGFMMYVSWVDAPPGEFHELGEHGRLLIHWEHWLLLGLLWFVFVFLPCSLGGGVAVILWWRHRRR